MPLKHKDTKIHKGFISNCLSFVYLCAFVSLWQKKEFLGEGSRFKIEMPGFQQSFYTFGLKL